MFICQLTSLRFSSYIFFYLKTEYFRSRNFREFREFSPNSLKFKTRKILYWPIRESLCTRNFSIFSFFLQNCYLSVRKMLGARKRGLNTTKAWNNKVFLSLLFLSGSKRFLKTTKKFNLSVYSRKFKTRKIPFWPIRESFCREMQKHSRIFRLAKDSAPKVMLKLL